LPRFVCEAGEEALGWTESLLGGVREIDCVAFIAPEVASDVPKIRADATALGR
jgi:hypothetical protein